MDIKAPEYLATKHPFGRMPVLIDDGFQLYESRAISRYLAIKYQGTKNSTILLPTDLQKAALVEQFISVEASYYHQHVDKLIGEVVFSKFHNRASDPEVVKKEREDIGKTLDVYEKLLEGRDYIAGEFSLADIFHLANSHYAVTNGHSDLWNDPKRPNVARWWKNVTERKSWKTLISESKLF